MTETSSYDKLKEHERIIALAYVLRRMIVDQESIIELQELFNALTNMLVDARELKLDKLEEPNGA